MKRLIRILKITTIALCSILIAAFVILLIISKVGNSEVNARIEGIGISLFAVSCNSIDGSDDQLKFVFSFNDQINAGLRINEPSKVRIRPVVETLKRKIFRSKDISFYLEPNSKVVISGAAKEFSLDYDIVDATPKNKQQVELRNELLPYYEIESRLYSQAALFQKTDPGKSKKLTQQFDSIRFNVVAIKRTEFAKRHLNYEISPLYFLESHVPRDTTIKYARLLSPEVKASPEGIALAKMVSGWLATEKGKTAPAFSQTALDGKAFSTEQLRGKYAVLDFWGTWCGPCMYGVPKMKEYYNKYKDRLEFVGIACADVESDWKKTIEKNGMNWVHILNDASKSDISVLYGVSSYPTKVIINPNGEIISKLAGENEIFYHQIDSLMAK
jgi:thiol-disulfide isomerase/thioredoxin